MTNLPDDHEGYISLGLFLFGLVLVAVAAGAALVAWAITGIPMLLVLAVAMIIGGIYFIVHTLRQGR